MRRWPSWMKVAIRSAVYRFEVIGAGSPDFAGRKSCSVFSGIYYIFAGLWPLKGLEGNIGVSQRNAARQCRPCPNGVECISRK